MFNQSKYTRLYESIITRAKQRSLDSYTERHHIIPRSLGGNDDADNLVDLTGREHFICHWLLTKMVDSTNDKWKMMNALGYMMWAENQTQERYKVSARLYEQLKTKHSEMKSWAVAGERNGMYGKHHSEEAREKIRQSRLGNQINEEQRDKIRQFRTGKKWTEEQKQLMSERRKGKTVGENNGMYGRKHSEETRAKIGAVANGRKLDPAVIAARSEKIKGQKRSPETLAKMREAWERRRQKADELGVDPNTWR